ncbi:MAG: hypothetical protein NT154_01945 [Verrucomicrobia bacterium]|nr:hypothetical protein [Verrucomicrobiota bacterium]
MALNATARRRWFGACVLLAALAMLIGGETVLKGKLGKLTFVVYWMVCFALTGLAILIAFLDAWVLQHRIRQEQRELFENTLKEIKDQARTRSRGQDRRQRDS